MAAACADQNSSSPATVPAGQIDPALMPAAIRSGRADQATQPVETSVSANEVLAAVQRILGAAPVCMSWPSLWVDDMGSRDAIRVRFDLMRRDWGGDVADDAKQDMDAFVDMGFLTKRARDDVAHGVIDFTLTDLGRGYMRGTISSDSGSAPKFCAPGERHVVAITQMEWGSFPCGHLKAHFSFDSPDHTSWATSPGARAVVVEALGPSARGQGAVTLSREWYSEEQVPQGVVNGSLQSICFDTQHTRILGDDLTLTAGGS
jgi:hypothetical protein